LKNVTAAHQRAEEVKQKFDFVVSRAVTQIDKFLPWVSNKFYHKQKNAYPNGIFYLKGGDLTEEFKGVRRHTEILDLEKYFSEEFFETKKVVYIKMI
jgi:16S rRNA (guanine527-N7)-methyltransferase